MKQIIVSCLMCLILAWWCQAIESATASDEVVRESLKPVAARFVRLLKSLKQEHVSVGEITSPPQREANYGGRFADGLIERLNELQPGIVDRSAPYVIRGSYSIIVDKNEKEGTEDGGQGLVKIKLSMTDGDGQKIDDGEITSSIKDNSTLMAAAGVSGRLPPNGSWGQRNETVLALLTENDERAIPQGVIEGTRMKSDPASKYSVEILVANGTEAPKGALGWMNVKARQPRHDDGDLFVDLVEDEVYAVRVYNESDTDAAVTVEIDGVNIFRFTEVFDETGQPRYRNYIVEKGDKPTIIPGWHLTNERSAGFKITEYGQGVSSKNLPNIAKGAIGLITVRIAMAWSDSSPPLGALAKRGGKIETGIGPPIEAKSKEVKRSIGSENDIISIRYARP